MQLDPLSRNWRGGTASGSHAVASNPAETPDMLNEPPFPAPQHSHLCEPSLGGRQKTPGHCPSACTGTWSAVQCAQGVLHGPVQGVHLSNYGQGQKGCRPICGAVGEAS